MARSSRLLGVVADDRSLLMAVEELHRCIDVEYPWLGKKRLRAIVEMTAQPHSAFFLVDRRKAASHRVFTEDLLHVQKLRQNAITA